MKVTESVRWVVKVGSSLVTAGGKGLDHAIIRNWCAQIVDLRRAGINVVVVSSGAVAEGMARLAMARRPVELSSLQAAAAVGQLGVAQAWDSALGVHQVKTAQVLLTHDDCADRGRYLNARNTLRSLLAMDVVPVVNENDTVATDEIRFGDNDTLAALVADLVGADQLVILTDQAGLMTADPRTHEDAELIREAEALDDQLLPLAGAGGALGRGGMQTKVEAARRAARMGVSTVIASGREPDVLKRLASGGEAGTRLRAGVNTLAGRKRWISNHVRVRGQLVIDDGACEVLLNSGKSLLPVGIVSVVGVFSRGDLVACVDGFGREIARGVVNYDATQMRQLCGVGSAQIPQVLGQPGEPEAIHRDNLVITARRTQT